MCQVCQRAVDRAAGVVGRDAAEYALWNETAFPFARGRQTARQLGRAVARMLARERGQVDVIESAEDALRVMGRAG